MLSMFDPIYVGIDEFGQPVCIRIIYKNLLAAGEPGGGKSGLLNTFAAHAALCGGQPPGAVRRQDRRARLLSEDIADEFVGPDLDHAIITLLRLQKVMDNRYAWLRAHRRRKIEPGDGITVITSIFDEIALYSATLGTEASSNGNSSPCSATWSPAAAPPPCPSSPPPSGPRVDIIPKSLRDLFGYRAAFRCTSTGSVDIILGDGWSGAGFSATDISPGQPGRSLPHRRRRHPPADQGRLPVRRRHHRPGRPRRLDPPHPAPPRRRPGHRRRLTTTPERNPPCHSPPTPPPARPSSPALRDLADYLAAHPAVPVP